VAVPTPTVTRLGSHTFAAMGWRRAFQFIPVGSPSVLLVAQGWGCGKRSAPRGTPVTASWPAWGVFMR
jgi:hypothetical protein